MKKIFLLLAIVMIFGVLLAVPASADIPTDIVDQYWIWYPNPGGDLPGYWVNPVNNLDPPTQAPLWGNEGTTLGIFNVQIPENVKNIWVEVKYVLPQTEIAPLTVVDPTGAVFQPIDAWISENGQFVTWQWQLPWQPCYETVNFGCPTFYNLEGIELVEVATQCVPEPGSLFLLLPGIAGLGAFIRRKR